MDNLRIEYNIKGGIEMFYHFKILLRHFSRQKLYTIITLSCLAVGLTVTLMTASYAVYELNYDRLAPKNETAIYRLQKTFTREDVRETGVLIREDFIKIIATTIPEVKNVCGINQAHPGIRFQERSHRLDHLITADPQFFDFFPATAIQGRLEDALLEPKSIILTESLAKKMAGESDLMGEVVTLGKGFDYKVAAIIQDWPKNSHLQVEAIIPNSESPFGSSMGGRSKSGQDFYYRLYETYVMVPRKTNISELEQKINQSVLAFRGKYPSMLSYKLIALEDIYMKAESAGVASRHGDMRKIYLLIAISIVTLMIAGINYVNLTTARASKRAGEIGIKKTIGAGRASLFRQFMFESFALTATAAGIAFGLAELLLPTMRRLLLVDFSLYSFYTFPGILYVILCILLISFLAGFYPALYLSRFGPITVLREKTGRNPRRNFITRSLVVLQFSISLIFIIGAMVISGQLEFVNHIDLGYNKEYLLHLNFDISSTNHPLFRNRLLEHINIKSVAFSRGVPGQIRYTMSSEGIAIKGMDISPEFIETFQMKLVDGRNPLPGDINRGCLVNETALRTLNEKGAVGARFFGKEIIGVVKDFHFASVHTEIEPLYMPVSDKHFEDVTIRVSAQRIDETIQYIQDVWKELYPDMPFDFYFYDEKIESQYRSEHRLGELIDYVAAATVLMSCFGLIGLVLFLAESRTKEIGIRKVFGASVTGILTLFMKNFLVLIFLANLIAWPVAWIAMNKWLQDFAYRMQLHPRLFLSSGFLTLLLALTTVAICTLKAALANPVESLRYE